MYKNKQKRIDKDDKMRVSGKLQALQRWNRTPNKYISMPTKKSLLTKQRSLRLMLITH